MLAIGRSEMIGDSINLPNIVTVLLLGRTTREDILRVNLSLSLGHQKSNLATAFIETTENHENRRTARKVSSILPVQGTPSSSQ